MDFPMNRPVSDNLESLLSAWEGRSQAPEAAFFLLLAKKAVALGHPTLACDIVHRGLADFPKHPELRYLAAIALARAGSLGHAESVLQDLLPDLDQRGTLYVDALSLQGRIAKDSWARLPESAEGQQAVARACEAYRQAYAIAQDPFPGINAASLSMMTGQTKTGLQIAAEVHGRCFAHITAGKVDYWTYATLGEACLLLGRMSDAIQHYTEARRRAAGNFDDIASMRRQLKLLAKKIPVPDDVLRALSIPRPVVFSGHLIDAASRAAPRFPAELEASVANAIDAALTRRNAGFGYCSAACGADILFIEQMQQRKAEVNIVLPFRREDFVAVSVAFAGEQWVARFEQALGKAASVTFATDESHLDDDVLYGYADTVMQGMAMLRGEQLAVEPLMLAVLDNTGEINVGGTAQALLQWKQGTLPTEILDLRALREVDGNAKLSRAEAPGADAPGAVAPGVAAPLAPAVSTGSRPVSEQVRRQIKTMLFADVVGFSKLKEENTPSFFVEFLDEVARQIALCRVKPAFCNTWGDGLYAVFDNVLDGAEFALRLRDAVAALKFKHPVLPQAMQVRIGMHAGPVFPAPDPIIEKLNFFGSHVNRAARIEPIAVPGSVYVSEQMSAMLTAAGSHNYACDYLGSLALAKQFGRTRLYRLRRVSGID